MKTLKALLIALTLFVGGVVEADQKKPERKLASVVVPVNPLPASLPIGDLEEAYNWSVTNTDWSIEDNSLTTTTYWELTYAKGSIYFSSSSLKVSSFEEFTELASKKGQLLLTELRKRTDVDPSENIRYIVRHDYADLIKKIGARGIKLSKDLGPRSGINADSFLGLNVDWNFTTIRIPGLEKLEILVDSDPPYHYEWPSKVATPAGVYPKELTRAEFISLNSWYTSGEYRATFRLTVAGKTVEYTQAGEAMTTPWSEIERDNSGPSALVLTVHSTPGSNVVLMESGDMVNWAPSSTRILWNENSGVERVTVYPSPSTGPSIRLFKPVYE